MNTLEKFEKQQVARLADKRVDAFNVGDTVKVNVKIIEGNNERIQAFEGVCIAKKNRALNTAFTVRKISHGEGVERIFQLHSPLIESVTLVRSGDVRRAKLYYMRGLRGKAARIKEKQDIYAQVEQELAGAPAQGLTEEQQKAATEAKAEAKAAKKARARSSSDKKADKKSK